MKKLLSLVFGLILSMSSAFAETCDFNISSIYTSGTPTITSAGIYKTGNSQNYIRTQNDVNFSTANTWSFKWRFTYHPATNDQGIMSGNGGTNVQAIINSEGRPRFSFGAGNDTWNAGVWNDTSISFRYQDSVTYDNEIYFNGTRYGFKVDGVEIGGIDSTEKAGNTYFAIGVERGRTGGQYSRAEWDLTNTSLIVDGVNQFLWCQSPIKIATTAYNSARFSPVVTELNDTIATIRSVVTNTINQTKAIADLQANKQTRPDEQCPAGKKCLLVEDNDGQPHWYEIIESANRLPNGFTELEYVTNNDNTYLNTGIIPNVDNIVMEIKVKPSGGSWYIWQSRDPADAVIHGLAGATSGSKIGFSFPNNATATSTITRTSNILTVRSTMLNGHGILYVHDDATNESNTQTKEYTFSAETLPLWMFGNQRNDRVNAGNAVYYAKMYMNNELVMDYVPAKRNSDGAIGFYDFATNTFKLVNAGSLTAGPEI